MTTQDPRECKHLLPNNECKFHREIVGKHTECDVNCPLLQRQQYDFDCPDFTPKTTNKH